MPHPCYFLERTNRVRIDLRRYITDGQCPKMPGTHSYHNAIYPNFKVIEATAPPPGADDESWDDEEHRPAKDCGLWPMRCACGYNFTDAAYWQMFSHRIYRRADTGAEMVLREATPGALYYADWHMTDKAKGLYTTWDWDNQSTPPLYCVTPGGEWNIDGRASNCTLPQERTHRCWVRHGEIPNIHVDKNGFTCAAGAGSIAQGDRYHGFLHNGCLT